MKRLIALILVCALLTGCTFGGAGTHESTTTRDAQDVQVIFEEEMPDFSGLDDTSLLSYMEDKVYTELVAELNNEGYFIENVQAIYISKEYLDELSYNSQENIFFGYKLSELDECFAGTRYVFALDENGQTTVKEFEKYDDTYERVLKNVAIGAGVILLCVTVSAVTGGLGAPAVSMIFAASAKTAATMALSSGVISGVSAGVVTGIKTGDFDEAVKSAALAGSESFKWGAVTGAITGGVGKAVALKGATLNGLTMNEAAAIQKESKYPLDVIKQFSSREQYEICKSAGLSPQMVNGNIALIRKIDPNLVDDMGRTNLQRMQQGLAAIDSNGASFELHHIGQHADSTLAMLTKAEHMQGGNNKIWHVFGEATEVHGPGNTWDIQRQEFWKHLASLVAKG